MAITAAVIVQEDNQRSEAVCNAMIEGIRQCGDVAVPVAERTYAGPNYQVAVFYGLKGQLKQAFIDYRRFGRKAVYIDLGYWGRLEGGRRAGYHKIAVNDRHPTKYFQKYKHPFDRAHKLGIYPKPWRAEGRHILVAGMGAKAATVEGMLPEKWEADTINELRKFTDRPIVYRPKPSWSAPKGIEGAVFSPKDQFLDDVLEDCHAVVTHHSNVAVDGLVAGVPAFCFHGVAAPMSLQDLSKIEKPIYPQNRNQWIADIAYCQWNVAEMAQGLPWKHLKDEGLIP